MKINRIARKLSLAALLTLPVAGAWAVPAKPGLHQYELPDGTSIAVSIVGDEFFHYYLTADGYPLVAETSGRLCYAKTDAGGSLVSTGVAASDIARRTPAERRLLDTIDPDAVQTAARAAANRRIAARRRIPSEIVTNYPTSGNPKSIVLLVEFQDVKFSIDNPHQAFENLANKDGYDHNGATGSVADYYRDNSNGSFVPDFEIFGPVTLPQGEPYYGAESATAYDVQGWLMAQDGIKAMREQYPDVDFSEYDNDGDGFVDNVFIFYAGYGQNEGAAGWTIWPHSAELWDMYGIDLTYNGVKFNKYACTNELRGTSGKEMTGIGTFVHEYSHVLGLMDHYPTHLASTDVSAGSFDVMDRGPYNNNGNTPPCFNAFERYTLGWLNPRRLSGPENVVLEPLAESNVALLIETANENEFFILENRRQTGWDTYTGGHGMLIWHIDYDKELWDRNSINNEFAHQRVDLVEADRIYGEETRSGDPFPGSGNVHSFTSASTPAMTTWVGVDPDMPLTDISEVDDNITFRVKGGGDALEIPETEPATDIATTSFTANWKLVAGIGSYELAVSEGLSKVPFLTVKVEGKTSYKVENLKPATDYNYVVRSCDGDRISYDSEPMTVRTLDPTIDMLRPTVLPATDVTESGFTARWEALEGASGYKVSVYAKEIIDPMTDVVDFSDGLDLPEGWVTSCGSTGNLANYYGEAAPSLRMMADGDRISTPAYPGMINSLSFWYRGNSTDDNASISVESMVDGAWQTVHTVSPVVRTEGTVVTIGGSDDDALMPSGTTRLRIVFHRGGSGSLYIDDIIVRHDGSFNPVYAEGWNGRDCGQVLSAAVGGLSGHTQYFYTVTAYGDGGMTSLVSDEVAVYTERAGIAGVGDGATATFDVYSIMGVCVKRGATEADIATLPAGIYFSKGHKFVVR